MANTPIEGGSEGTERGRSIPPSDGAAAEVGRPVFTVKLGFYGPPIHDPRADERRAFWQNVAGPDVSDEDINQFERELLQNFGTNLVEELHEHGRPQGEDADRFVFTVDNIRYGSLFFDVSIFGIVPFLSFFYDKPEIAMAFLEMSVPQAFDDSISSSIKRVHTRIYPNTVLDSEFRRIEAPSSPEVSSDAPEKPGWADVTRRAFQIPFLVPLLLALAVLYVAASFINGERDRLEKREAALDAREKDVRTVDDARVAKLEALTLDLVKQLRAEKPASGPDVASAAKAASAADAAFAGKAASAPKP